MAGSSIGTIFRVTTFGESHGAALGAVVDGCPAGIELSEADIMPYMERRRPNGGLYSTKRSEADAVRILSGVFEGRTTGAPIALVLENADARSSDYSDIAHSFRPGHADFGFFEKYGIRDYRGGGRSSGRETAARVAAGAVAAKCLARFGISAHAEVAKIGSVDAADAAACEELLKNLRSRGDSIGSTVSCRVSGLPAGLGDPVFEKLDANLAKAMFSIGAVKGLDIGDGHEAAAALGSANNDAFRAVGQTPGASAEAAAEEGLGDGRALCAAESPCGSAGSEGPSEEPLKEAAGARAFKVTTATNHAGGILGGISTGNDIVLTVYFKPTPSISLPQEAANEAGENISMTIKGRHDPVIGPRAAVVVESMANLVVLDALLVGLSARADRVADFVDAYLR